MGANGNCGYRSIASLLSMGEDSLPIICQGLVIELRDNPGAL